MAYDPSVISSIGENVMRPVVDAPARAMQLGDLINKQQISKIALQEDQEEQQTYGALKGYIDQNKLDMSKPEDMNKIAAEASRMNPKVGMKLQREFTAAQTGQAALTRENIALYTEKLDAIANAALPFYQQAQQLKAQGKSSQEIDAAMLPGLQQTIKTMQAVKLRNGEPLMDAEMSQKAAALVSSPNVMQNLEQMLTTTKSSREWLMRQEEKVRGEKRDEASNRETKIEVRNGKPHNILFEKTTGREIKDLGETTTPATAFAQTNAAASALGKEDYRFIAEQVWAGDKSALQNVGRGVQGAKDLREIRREITAIGKEKGFSASDLAAKVAEFEGMKSGERSLGTRMANIEQAAGEASKMIDLARESSKNVPRGTFLPWNQLVKGENVITNDPAYAKFAANTLAVINTWARAISPTGQPTIADKEHANAVLNTAQSQDAYEAVLDQFQTEMMAALAAPAEVKQKMHDRFTGKPSSPPPPAGAPGAPSARGAGGGGGGAPVRVNTPEEAAALAPGTVFITPDGRRKVR